MKVQNVVLTAWSLLWLAGCAAAPKPAPPMMIPPPAVPEIAKVPAPDMSPVPAPAHLFVRATWKSPAESLKTLEAIVGRPLEPFVQDAIGDAEVAELLAREAPGHAVVPVDPNASATQDRDRPPGLGGAFSLPLRDFARARAYAELHASVEAVRPGVVRIRRGAGEKPACTLAVAAGVAPARLVCGDSDNDVDALLPWLTRTAPLETGQTSDLVITASGPVLWAAVERHLPEILDGMNRSRRIEAAQQRWLEDGVQLLREAKGMDLTLSIDPKEVRLAFGFDVSGSKSRFTSFAFSGKPTGLPPELSRVPPGATIVGFSSGMDAALGRAFLREIIELENGREYRPMPPAGRDKRIALADRAPFFAPFFYVRGEVEPTPARRNESHGEKLLREERSAVGWSLALVDAPPAEMLSFVSDLVAEGQRSSRAPKGKSPPPAFRMAPAPASFPAGSKAVVFESDHYDYSPQTGKSLPAKKQNVVLVLSPAGTAGTGARTLVSLGVDTKELARRAKAFLDPATRERESEERDAILKADFTGASAGFALVPSSISRAVSSVLGTSSPLRGTPHRGETPVPFVLRREKDGGRLVAEVRLHDKSVVDAGAMARFGLDMLGMVMRRDGSGGGGILVPGPMPATAPD